jgi:hypothetical protein
MIKRILILSLLFSTCTLFLYAQDTAQLKRTAYKLTVAVDKKTFYEEALKETPFILPDNTIQLYAGETVFIEVEQEDGIIKSLKAVKEIKDASKNLTISFTQTAKKKVHELMMLKVTNPFNYKLSYKASIFLLHQKKWINTDVFPVEPGLSGFETWPDIITSIGLGNWSFQK